MAENSSARCRATVQASPWHRAAPGTALLSRQELCCTETAQLEPAALSMLQAGKLKVREIVICFRTQRILGQD